MGKAVDPVIAHQAMALAEAGVKANAIARLTGLAPSTVSGIIHGHNRWGEISDSPVAGALRSEQQKILESGYRASSALLLERALDPDKLDKASTYQLMIASKISLDASRLLAGQSTENISIQSKVELSGLDQLCAALSQTLVLADQTKKAE